MILPARSDAAFTPLSTWLLLRTFSTRARRVTTLPTRFDAAFTPLSTWLSLRTSFTRASESPDEDGEWWFDFTTFPESLERAFTPLPTWLPLRTFSTRARRVMILPARSDAAFTPLST
ncbi:hypothetical protein BDF19DRAFT_449102 [Syncephalis fuscata]|nr:hypothetical protein BDF19DRAFT_449102 [Syncephalis fuscata]